MKSAIMQIVTRGVAKRAVVWPLMANRSCNNDSIYKHALLAADSAFMTRPRAVTTQAPSLNASN